MFRQAWLCFYAQISHFFFYHSALKEWVWSILILNMIWCNISSADSGKQLTKPPHCHPATRRGPWVNVIAKQHSPLRFKIVCASLWCNSAMIMNWLIKEDFPVSVLGWRSYHNPFKILTVRQDIIIEKAWSVPMGCCPSFSRTVCMHTACLGDTGRELAREFLRLLIFILRKWAKVIAAFDYEGFVQEITTLYFLSCQPYILNSEPHSIKFYHGKISFVFLFFPLKFQDNEMSAVLFKQRRKKHNVALHPEDISFVWQCFLSTDVGWKLI